MAADRSICWFRGADFPDDLAAHRAAQFDWDVVRLRAGHRFWRRLLARWRAGDETVAGVRGVLLRSRGGRPQRLPRHATRQQEVIERIARTTAVVCVLLAVVFAV